MARLVEHLCLEIRLLGNAVERMILSLFPKGPPPVLAVVPLPSIQNQNHDVPENAWDPKEEGILFAVPKHRRSREKRLTRKFGSEKGHHKMLPYRKLLTCDDCGHVHEPGRLCPNCYGENMKITKAMQEAMVNMQGLNPIEHESFPVFKGDKVTHKDGFHEGKRIFEVPEERPKWFSNKLTTKSTVTTSSNTTVIKPNNLA